MNDHIDRHVAAVVALALCACAAIVGQVVVIWTTESKDTALIQLASTAVGAIAGIAMPGAMGRRFPPSEGGNNGKPDDSHLPPRG